MIIWQDHDTASQENIETINEVHSFYAWLTLCGFFFGLLVGVVVGR